MGSRPLAGPGAGLPGPIIRRLEAPIQSLRRAAARLAAIEIWVVAPAAGVGMIWPAALPGALTVLLLFWPVRWLAYGRLVRRTPADLALLLLLLASFVSLWATALLEVTLPQTMRLWVGIGLFYALVYWTTSEARLRVLLAGTALAGAGLALASPALVLWSAGEKLPFLPSGLYDRFPLLVTDSANPNVMAGFLAVLLPIPLAGALMGGSARAPVRRTLLGLGAALIAAALLLTQSRAGLLGLAGGLLCLILIRWPRSWPVWALLALAGGLGAIAVGADPLLEALSESQTLGSLAGRLETWSRALYMIQDFPFTGIGMGSFTRVLDLLYPLFSLPPGQVLHAHNLFLQIAVDLGLPGLMAWMAAWLVVLMSAWNLARLKNRPALAGAGAGLLAGQAALGMHGLLDAVTWGMVRPAPIIWGLWGLTVAAWQLAKTEAD